MSELISVIIPAYNAERHLAEAIDSALKQTYSHIEIVIVDDGSTDATPEIGRGYARKDARCRYFHCQNGGVSSARNRGIEKASGSLIAFLDADDLWEESKLQLQAECLTERPEAVVLTELRRFVDSNSGRQYLTTTEPPPYTDKKGYLWTLLNLRNPEMPSFGTALVKKHSVQNVGLFDERLRTSEDWDLWMRLALRYQFVHVHAPLRLYRKHQESLTVRNELKSTLQSQLLVIEKIGSLCRLNAGQIASVKARKQLEFAQISVYGGSRLLALSLLVRALKSSPADLRKTTFVRPVYTLFRSILEPAP